MDTETTLIEKPYVPRLAMVSVSDGSNHHLLKPEQLPEFLTEHLPIGCHLVFHNVAFDFAVIDQYLNCISAHDARNWLWTAVDEDRVHDTMLLAALITLARHDVDHTIPSLADAVKEWCGYELVKDEYRLRFGETIGVEWADMDPGFLRYAAADAIATFQLFERLTHQADHICQRFNLSRMHGYLTEAIQVKAAICLACIHRNGLHIDQARVAELREQIEGDIQRAIKTIQAIDPSLWHYHKKTGELKTNKVSGLPKQNMTNLMEHLKRIATEHKLSIPTTPKGKLTTSVNKCWCQYRELDPLVDAYCEYTQQTKHRTFFAGLQQPHIHPRYQTLVRTGRTSCSSPNIQQLPSGSPIREAVVARPGYLLFTIDYNSLELRTLATVCHQRFGFSTLREVLIQGIDPHSYTAAMFAGVFLSDFLERPDKKQLRQHAKVFNFGIPAGFGATALVDHAKFSYGVTLTQEDAQRFIEQLINQVYPELGLYLSEDTAGILANALHANAVDVRATWPEPWHPGMIRKILMGNHVKADGTPYKKFTVDLIWSQLEHLCRNATLMPHIQQRNTADDSPLRNLLLHTVSTTTGRMRGGIPFTAAKNTPFQGLAADGCKQAMWDLTKAGYRIVAFIHDEFIIELNRSCDVDQASKDIDLICRSSMQPFVPGIPVPCEFSLTERWHKGAEAVYDQSGRLQIWQPS